MNKFLYFAIGAIIGSGATYFACKANFEAKLSEQANDIYNYYNEKNNVKKEESEETKVEENKEKYTETIETAYNKIISKNNYNNIAPTPSKDVSDPRKFGTYVVARGFAGKDGYELKNETYDHWGNDVLTDASGRPLSLEEIDRLVGLDYADHLGEVDKDSFSTYFRNEELGVDIEIYDNGEEEYHDPTTQVNRDDD